MFFTSVNPFHHPAFALWLKLVPENAVFLEPFAGANSIVKMLAEIRTDMEWACFDLNRHENLFPKFPVIKQDTISDFPKNFAVAITNPPYLAKNSATRSGLSFPDSDYDNIYKLCLNLMLKNCRYVAAIIPESFIKANIFHERLYAFISLPVKMFADTDYPVCLSLFVPQETKRKLSLSPVDFHIFSLEKYMGKYSEILLARPRVSETVNWKFNDPQGVIGLVCVDNTRGKSIAFKRGDEIRAAIKTSSRSLTRIGGLPEKVSLDGFVMECNRELEKYRENTGDLFMTAFRGLRMDGFYRRRIDFADARILLNKAFLQIMQI